MKPIIKWPGGKSGEIQKIEQLIPAYDRYIEPFFGGGALFFHLPAKPAAINDISGMLMEYYRLIKQQDQQLYKLLLCYSDSFQKLVDVCSKQALELFHIFFKLKEGLLDQDTVQRELEALIKKITKQLDADFYELLVLDKEAFDGYLLQMTADKYIRTVRNYEKNAFNTEDLCENLITGFTSGYYMYFRKVFNDINLNRTSDLSLQYRVANFYFIREYCYGSMFRYNAKGEFNIPYGGMSYNRKDMKSKIENMFSPEVKERFAETDIYCCDFETFLEKAALTENDFMFLDPPYDTEFSDYDGNDFTKRDQERLAAALKATPAKFILIIKNTEFIKNLYEGSFHILSFDKHYTYNVRQRNDRATEHLIITNFPISEKSE